MTHLQQTRIKRMNDALSAIKDCHAHMAHIQQLKIALLYGRTHLNLRFQSTNEEVGLCCNCKKLYITINVTISAQKTLRNYGMRALFALDTISAWCVLPLERMA